jgi:hypothetical protein
MYPEKRPVGKDPDDRFTGRFWDNCGVKEVMVIISEYKKKCKNRDQKKHDDGFPVNNVIPARIVENKEEPCHGHGYDAEIFNISTEQVIWEICKKNFGSIGSRPYAGCRKKECNLPRAGNGTVFKRDDGERTHDDCGCRKRKNVYRELQGRHVPPHKKDIFIPSWRFEPFYDLCATATEREEGNTAGASRGFSHPFFA